MPEVQTGIWHWEAPHPEWHPEDWDHTDVSSYAIDVGDRLLFVDPLAVPAEVEELAAGRETAIVLTNPWHRRDGIPLAERINAPIYVPPPDPPDPDPVPGQVFKAGDRLPVGVEAFPGREPNDLMLWIEGERALVAGDTLVDKGDGLVFPVDWVPDGVRPEDLLDSLRPLLDLPVEVVLPTHGQPTDRAALERALT
jgi:glyoxylase-like metal-dependent hydrolase (beta-lactamase superfamily II)